MSVLAMVECPACKGKGGFAGLGCGDDGCRPIVLKCRGCDGRGQVTKLRADEIRSKTTAGQKMREDRVARGASLREEAKRLGISVVDLSDRERGQ